MTSAASRGVLAVRTASGDAPQRVRPPRLGRRSFGAPGTRRKGLGAATRDQPPMHGTTWGQQTGAGLFRRLRGGLRDRGMIGALAGPPARRLAQAENRARPRAVCSLPLL